MHLTLLAPAGPGPLGIGRWRDPRQCEGPWCPRGRRHFSFSGSGLPTSNRRVVASAPAATPARGSKGALLC